jgi:hypothetical protein
MSTPQAPKPAKLVIGLFMPEKPLFSELAKNLVKAFGPADLISPWFPFDCTDYYDAEMGSPLFRRMLAFEQLIEQDRLAEIKCMTNDLEKRYSTAGKRSVNIDPGYLLHERFVLATGKNFAHRIYLTKGIYADLTLIYRKGGFQKLPWTYPDYADSKMWAFLKRVRSKYAEDLKKVSGLAGD